MKWKQIFLIVAIVVVVRGVLAWIFGAEVADLSQYHWMADIIQRGENIYETQGLFHYTPLPMFLPDWSLQVSQALKLPFHFVVKWPMILADVGIALILWWQARKCGLEKYAFLISLGYAFNPVSLLTTVFHGSYSVLPAFFTLLAYCLITIYPDKRYYRLSALSLGMAIGLRGYPILYLPFILRKLKLDWRHKVVYVILAGLPSLISFIPFVFANFQAVWTEVFSYSGVADFGWIAAARSYWLLLTGNQYLPGILSDQLLGASKRLFLVIYVIWVIQFWRKHNQYSLLTGILGTILLFLGIYGGISAQYLIWVVPFALLYKSRWEKAFTWTAAGSMVFFYLFYFPAILFGSLPIHWTEFNSTVMVFRLIFDIAYWLVTLAWFVWIIFKPVPDINVRNDPSMDFPVTQAVKENSNFLRIPHRLWGQAFWAELIIITYVVLISVLGVKQLTSPTTVISSQPKELQQIEVIWSVGKNGNGSGEFNAPLGLGVDSRGDIYVADRGNHRLVKFLADGTPGTTWSGDTDGKVPFIEPSGIAIDPNNNSVWVLDSGNGWIYRLQPGGKLDAVIDGSQYGFYNPRGLTISQSGDLFISDTGSARVCHLNPQGKIIAQWGTFGTKPREFQDPVGLAIQGNHLFIADVNNNRVVHYDLDGKLIGAWDIQEGSDWLTADNLGHIFISNSQNGKIRIYAFDGKFKGELDPGKEIPSIGTLSGITATRDGRVYVVGENQLVQYKLDWKQ